MDAVKDRIRAKAKELGFADIGFAAASGRPEWRRDLADWLAEGRQGDMGWMAENTDRRVAPDALWRDAGGIVVLAMSYAPPGGAAAVGVAPERGAISVYARNKDYHDLIKKRLKVLAGWIAKEFGGDVKVFVDTAPIMEKPLAAEAGLGWRGRHTNLVSRRLGSWFFLAEIFTTLTFAPDAPEKDHCGRCRACQDACPTGAIEGPGRLDPRRCISYLTIEHKGHIPAPLRPAFGNRVYGCDDCLAICPWNKFALPTAETDFLPRAELIAPRLADLADLDDAGFREVFAGSPIKRVGRGRFVRNVLIAIGNSGRRDLAETARRLLADPSPLVRAMAVWALRRLAAPELVAECRRMRMAEEDDPDVLAEWD